MIKFKRVDNPPKEQWLELIKRPELESGRLTALCETIFQQVKESGDDALLSYSREFDGVGIESIYCSKEELDRQASLLDESLKLAINQAYNNIYTFHKAQLPSPIVVETSPGVFCSQLFRAIESVGLYIPGGTAPLFSTLLMLAIPAQLAGCSEIILSTPPNQEGTISPTIAYVATLCGIQNVLKLGGVQAIAALTFGTNCTKPVYKIYGPGNQYVVAAKQYAQQFGVAIDLPAGPSEVLVIADCYANPQFVAADLLSQAEHGNDSQVLLLSDSTTLIDAVFQELRLMANRLSRKQYILESLKYAQFINFNTIEECIIFANEYAPEHLILSVQSAEQYIEQVNNAGSVFLGYYTPESAGDYASGTNHTLPTNGFARSSSGVNMDSFIKKITVQSISEKGISLLGPTIERMALAEGLEAHALASKLRRFDIEKRRGGDDECI